MAASSNSNMMLSASSSSTSHSSLHHLPTDVLLYLIRSFLITPDILTLGRTDRELLHLTQRCDLTHAEMDIGAFIRDRGEADALFDALTKEQQTHFMQAFAKVKVRVKGDRQLPPPEPRSTLKQKYQIGRITSIHIPPKYGNRVLQHILPRLHLLPASIKAIKLSANIEIEGPASRFPAHLQRLLLSGHFAQSIEDVHFPSSLRELILQPDGYLHGTVEGLKLPSSLTVLHLSSPATEQPIENIVLPATLTELKLSFSFVQYSIDRLKLPEGLRTLILPHWKFNPPSFLQLKLPSSLTCLELSRAFKQSLQDWIPPHSLTRLQLPSGCQLRGDSIALTQCLLTFQLPDRTSSSSSSSPTSSSSSHQHVSSSSSIDYSSHLIGIEVLIASTNFLTVAARYPSITSIDLGPSDASPAAWIPPPNLRELIVRGYSASPSNPTIRFPDTLTRLEYRYMCRWDSPDFKLPPHLECLNVNGLGCGQFNTKPPPKIPPSLKRIELFAASDDWLLADVPDTCEFYESGKNSTYKRVTDARIQEVRSRNKLKAIELKLKTGSAGEVKSA